MDASLTQDTGLNTQTHSTFRNLPECAQADPGGSKSARKNLKILPIPLQYEGRGWGNMDDDTL